MREHKDMTDLKVKYKSVILNWKQEFLHESVGFRGFKVLLDYKMKPIKGC